MSVLSNVGGQVQIDLTTILDAAANETPATPVATMASEPAETPSDASPVLGTKESFLNNISERAEEEVSDTPTRVFFVVRSNSEKVLASVDVSYASTVEQLTAISNYDKFISGRLLPAKSAGRDGKKLGMVDATMRGPTSATDALSYNIIKAYWAKCVTTLADNIDGMPTIILLPKACKVHVVVQKFDELLRLYVRDGGHVPGWCYKRRRAVSDGAEESSTNGRMWVERSTGCKHSVDA